MLWKKQIVFMEFDLSTNVSNVTLQKKAKSPVYLKCHTKQSLGIDLKKCWCTDRFWIWSKMMLLMTLLLVEMRIRNARSVINEAVFSFRLTEMEMMQWLWFLCVFIAGISGSVNSLYHVFSVCYWYSHVIDLFFFEESMRGSPFFDCSWFWIVINCDGTHWNWWEGYSYPYRQQSTWVCWVLGFSLDLRGELIFYRIGETILCVWWLLAATSQVFSSQSHPFAPF